MRGSNVRLIVALIVASTLGAALIYSTVLGGTIAVVQVQQVLAAKQHAGDVRLNGTVVSHEGDAASAAGMRIQLADNTAYTHDAATARKLTIVYHGSVPSAFRDGRAILIDGKVQGRDFAARADTLSTKCPSKYSSTAVAPTQ
ncbi:MAG TPA: cytochrome c maturation protein CcmE [Gaiellales bacterium]